MTDVINSVKSVGATFSSWDSCMAKGYCKWPVIAAIIIGALIVLSVLWCIFSCLCCGISLCTACGKCLTCGNCCGACGSGGGRRKRDAEYQAMPPTPTPYQGYQPQPGPMMYMNNGPQFATFDAGSKRGGQIHEDSLPAMPSWDTATTRQVEDHTPAPPPQRTRNEMEMERMLPQHNYNQGPRSPIHESPYGQGPRSPIHDSPYASDLGAQNQTARGGYTNDYYDPPMSPAPTYYSTAPAAALGARTMSPQQTYDTSYRGANTAAPYPRESTQFAPGTGYSNYNSNPYLQQQQEQESGVRPPSLLQIGRKPVAGTYREV